MIDFVSLLRSAVETKTSDIHLTVGKPPVFRLEGRLMEQGNIPLTEEDTFQVVRELSTEEQIATYRSAGECDFATTFRDIVRIRCNIFSQQGHTALALRLLPMQIPTAEDLNLPEIIIAQAVKPRGLVLITGPTGSGKSSTLAALINHVNHNTERHVITLEEPIEYLHKSNRCIINQREVGTDTASFASGLRAALRQDPDVILVGEMRDLETISTAITAAETGHLVFGTLHTKGAASTIDRIIDSFPPEQQNQIRIQLADVLECVCGQTLLPCIRGGRKAAFEIMVMNAAIRSMILQNKTVQITSAMQTGKRQGMQLLDDALSDMVRKGEITLNDALSAANDPTTMRNQLGRY